MSDLKIDFKNKSYYIPTIVEKKYLDKGILELNKKGKSIIFDIGQDQMSHKAYYLSEILKKHDLNTVFFASDRYGIGKENEYIKGLDVTRLTYNSFKDWKNFIHRIKRDRPIHVEFYLGLRTWDLIFYILYTKMKRIPIHVKCRGGEILNWEKHSFRRKLANKIALRFSNLTTIRELYMPEYFLKYNIAKLDNLVFVHNSVPIPYDFVKTTEKPEIRILFLNSLKDFRNPLHLIEIAEELKKRGLLFKMNVVGFTDGNLTSYNTNALELEFIELVKLKELDQLIFCHKFTNETSKYFIESDIFLLPSKLVYCNNSLIEAMSYKCVPIIYNGDGADLIVKNNISGYITQPNPLEIVEKIEFLYHNPLTLSKMSFEARDFIEEEYNIESQANNMIGLYSKFLWK